MAKIDSDDEGSGKVEDGDGKGGDDEEGKEEKRRKKAKCGKR
jgi:hypothetical protein